MKQFKKKSRKKITTKKVFVSSKMCFYYLVCTYSIQKSYFEHSVRAADRPVCPLKTRFSMIFPQKFKISTDLDLVNKPSSPFKGRAQIIPQPLRRMTEDRYWLSNSIINATHCRCKCKQKWFARSGHSFCI